ncbi:MAG: DUF4079 family protein [Candidatus Binatia bacterium]
MLRYAHPLLAALTLALLAHLATLGVRGRNDRRHRDAWLARHAQLAPWIYSAVLASWLGGLVSMWLLWPTMELAASGHFRVSLAFVLVLTGSAVSSRWMHVAAVRAVHPWFGALALLLSAVQVFFGLPLLP